MRGTAATGGKRRSKPDGKPGGKPGGKRGGKRWSRAVTEHSNALAAG